MPNHLAGETSPYLLQHADNPVEWYPWGEEALARARNEDKPILLSIGYAACHWCHVMAHESFEDPATAAVMNDNFVNIKVDREERPDLDSVYMRAVQAMTGHGGWPMTVFLTPSGDPFYGGTYFPPADRQGMPSFTRVLRAVDDSYRNRRDSVSASVDSVRRIYDDARPATTAAATATATATTTGLDDRALESAFRGIERQYDARYGGLAGAPKFPPTMVLDFLLRHWARTGEAPALQMAHDTFLKMARGGIYDQIGGGFARYSVDEQWLVPHFEKMLYDNALLIRFGAHLFQATRDEEVRNVTEETVGWLAREMTSPEGGFYSSLDADSEGEEGKFYVWTSDELDSVLGEDAAAVKRYYGVTSGGNFEGHNILHVPVPTESAATRAAVHRAKRALYDVRARRVWPGRDDKILASWNGLALRGVVEAARTFARTDFAGLAARNADFLLTRMVQDGRVLRTHKDGVTRIRGFLEDQAAVGLGMLAMFEQSPESRWIDAARNIARVMNDDFWDADLELFFDTARDAEKLVTRPRDVTDNAIPSGTSLAVELLLRLADYDGNDAYRTRAWTVMSSLMPMVTRYPSAFGHLLGDAEYAATFACHGDYCDMPSPAALDVARASAETVSR